MPVEDRLKQIDVRVMSPDGEIQGRMGGGGGPRIRFRAGSLRRYDAGTLSRQLSVLLSALMERRQRQHDTVWTEYRRASGHPDTQHWHKPTREFRRQRRQLGAQSRSTAIRIGTKGMREFKVGVSAEALARFDEAAFTAAFTEAAASLAAEYAAAVRRLRDDYRARGIVIG